MHHVCMLIYHWWNSAMLVCHWWDFDCVIGCISAYTISGLCIMRHISNYDLFYKHFVYLLCLSTPALTPSALLTLPRAAPPPFSILSSTTRKASTHFVLPPTTRKDLRARIGQLALNRGSSEEFGRYTRCTNTNVLV